MDANQTDLSMSSMEDVKEILDNAISIKPRRQMSVQYSGGEPTLPYFIDAIKYARKAVTTGTGRDQRHEFKNRKNSPRGCRGRLLRLSAVRRYWQ